MKLYLLTVIFLFYILATQALDGKLFSSIHKIIDPKKKVSCPEIQKWGPGPPSEAFCTKPTDPNNKPASKLEQWFTKDVFLDLFPGANLGWGPTACWPYSYEAFVIAARYFPDFGTVSPNTVYSADENHHRDLAAFFSHAVQETGENNAGLYSVMSPDDAAECFYRGGFYNWFEGGPVSAFLDANNPGYKPEDGVKCNVAGKYCWGGDELNYWFPCRNDSEGCYFGRGAIQLSYNFNYGQFSKWLNSQNIKVDLLQNPNLVVTKMDPPLAIMGSLWFYMTPQPPKPSMHDIVMGTWVPGDKNKAAGYFGPIFGPTSLIINNECQGEDAQEPGGGGENRRIKAFRWFCKHFGAGVGADNLLTCKGMPEKFSDMQYPTVYYPDPATSWKEEPCDCVPTQSLWSGVISYYDPKYYSSEWVAKNEENRKLCVQSIYDNPKIYYMDSTTSPCLNHPPN